MTPEKHAQKLRELAYELIMADAHGHATKACEAGADALDLVATQGAELARLRTALQRLHDLGEWKLRHGIWESDEEVQATYEQALAALTPSEVR